MRIILVMFLCLGSLFSFCQSSNRSEYLFDSSRIMESPYGLCAHIGGKYKNPKYREMAIRSIRDLNVDIVRVDLYWNLIQAKSDDACDYRHIDALLNSTNNNNLKILPILDYSLDEYKDIWNHVDSWGKYVKGVSDRYSSDFDYWEIWNEQNLPFFWQGNPSSKQYYRILLKASDIIRKKDSAAKILMGGMAGMDSAYLTELLDLGAGDYFDIINFHYYYPNGNPENIVRELYKLQKILKKHKCKKKVWITETGYSTFPDQHTQLKDQVSEDIQAIRLPRLMLIAFSYGVDKVFWYCHQTAENNKQNKEDYFGIVRKNLSPKKAYYAYQTLIKMLPSGSSRPSYIIKDGVYICTWKTAAGRKMSAMWMETGERKVVLKGQCFDMYGNKIRSRTVNISSSIIYVQE